MSDESQPPAEVPAISPAPGILALAEADINSLDELFARDPLKLSDVDIDRIVGELRRKRGNWLVLEASGKTKGGAREPAAPKVVKPPKVKASDVEF